MFSATFKAPVVEKVLRLVSPNQTPPASPLPSNSCRRKLEFYDEALLFRFQPVGLYSRRRSAVVFFFFRLFFFIVIPHVLSHPRTKLHRGSRTDRVVCLCECVGVGRVVVVTDL